MYMNTERDRDRERETRRSAVDAFVVKLLIERVHNLPKEINQKVNLIARLEFKHSYSRLQSSSLTITTSVSTRMKRIIVSYGFLHTMY